MWQFLTSLGVDLAEVQRETSSRNNADLNSEKS